MKDWTEMPEASGPSSEGELFGQTYGSPGMPRIGAIPRLLSIEMMERERDLAERKYETRLRIERAAATIAISALEGGQIADELLREISKAADKAVMS